MNLKLKWTKTLDFKDFMKECKKLEIYDKIAKVKYATYIKTNGPEQNPDIMGVLSKILERLDRVETNQKFMQGQIAKTNAELAKTNVKLDRVIMLNNLKY